MKEIENYKIEKHDEEPALVNMESLSKILNLIGDKKVKVFWHIIANADVLNDKIYVYLGTVADICRDMKISKPTVIKAVKALEEINAIKREKQGMWLINPNLVFYDKDPDKYMPDDDYEDDEE